MADAGTRKKVVWSIKKLLIQLSEDQLQELAKAIGRDVTTKPPDSTGDNEAELFDYVVDYMNGDQLKDLEDEGLSELLSLQDIVHGLIGGHITSLTAEKAPAEAQLKPPSADTLVPDTQSADTLVPDTPSADSLVPDPGALETPPKLQSGLVRLSDVAALLPQREFKIFGGQISDTCAEMSYSNICKQVEDGLRANVPESEIVRAVIKVIKPGALKDMLCTYDGLTVAEIKGFLKSHMKGKDSSELFQELSSARQLEKETPQQFAYRLIGLKHSVLNVSNQGVASFNYDRNLVQGTFLRTLYQGFSDKHTDVRRDIKPHINDLNVTDAFILDLITESMREDTERQKRLAGSGRHRPASAYVVQQSESNDDSSGKEQGHLSADIQANRDAIQVLAAQFSSLNKNLERMFNVRELEENTHGVDAMAVNTGVSRTKQEKGKCNNCVKQGNEKCVHCFKCGQAGHRAVGCLLKVQRQGNGKRSPEGDSL